MPKRFEGDHKKLILTILTDLSLSKKFKIGPLPDMKMVKSAFVRGLVIVRNCHFWFNVDFMTWREARSPEPGRQLMSRRREQSAPGWDFTWRASAVAFNILHLMKVLCLLRCFTKFIGLTLFQKILYDVIVLFQFCLKTSNYCTIFLYTLLAN